MTLLVGVQLGDIGVLAADDGLHVIRPDGAPVQQPPTEKIMALRDGWASWYGPAQLGSWIRPFAGWPLHEVVTLVPSFRRRFGDALDARHEACGLGPRLELGLLALCLTRSGPVVRSIDADGGSTEESLQVILPGDVKDDVGREIAQVLGGGLRSRPGLGEILQAIGQAFVSLSLSSVFVGDRMRLGLILPDDVHGYSSATLDADPGELAAGVASIEDRIERSSIVCCEGPRWRIALDTLKAWRRDHAAITQAAASGQEQPWT